MPAVRLRSADVPEVPAVVPWPERLRAIVVSDEAVDEGAVVDGVVVEDPVVVDGVVVVEGVVADGVVDDAVEDGVVEGLVVWLDPAVVLEADCWSVADVPFAASLPFTRDICPVFQSLTSDELESTDMTDSPEARAMVIACSFG